MRAGERVAGRYTTERELGRGGMGSVWLARDEKFAGLVALKLAAAGGAARDQLRARFVREARIGHRLGRLEGFVRALDWGELDDGSLYMAMDLVPDARPLDLVSGTLESRLARLLAAARLVARAHDEGIVHRDLKPANVLVGGDGVARLADFGLAKLAGEADADLPDESLTLTGASMGTPPYMPPEQFEDARTAGALADVYALGVMLFTALTGRLPFEGTVATILKRQLEVRAGTSPMPRPRSLRPEVSPVLDDLCARALELEPARRLPSAAALVAELERALEDAPAPAPGSAAPAASRSEASTQDPSSSATGAFTPAPAPGPSGAFPATLADRTGRAATAFPATLAEAPGAGGASFPGFPPTLPDPGAPRNPGSAETGLAVALPVLVAATVALALAEGLAFIPIVAADKAGPNSIQDFLVVVGGAALFDGVVLASLASRRWGARWPGLLLALVVGAPAVLAGGAVWFLPTVPPGYYELQILARGPSLWIAARRRGTWKAGGALAAPRAVAVALSLLAVAHLGGGFAWTYDCELWMVAELKRWALWLVLVSVLLPLAERILGVRPRSDRLLPQGPGAA